MRLKYVGVFGEGVEVDLGVTGSVVVKHGEAVDFHEDVAAKLLKQNPESWEAVEED